MGGSIAITLAAADPEVVDRLILMDSASYPFAVPFKGRLPNSIIPYLSSSPALKNKNERLI
jgi:pimeloyl-ACP methyl ester carboxylesterase